MGRRRAVTPDERHLIRSKKSEGLSVSELARLFKRSSQTINKALQEVFARNARKATASASRVSVVSAPATTSQLQQSQRPSATTTPTTSAAPLQLTAPVSQRTYHQRAKPPPIVTIAHCVQRAVATATAASATRLANASTAFARDVQQAAREAVRESQSVPPHTNSIASLAHDSTPSIHERTRHPSARAPTPQAPQQLVLALPPSLQRRQPPCAPVRTNQVVCQPSSSSQSHMTSTSLAPVRTRVRACTSSAPAKAREQPANPSMTAASAPTQPQPAAQLPAQPTAPVPTAQAPPLSFVKALAPKPASTRTQSPRGVLSAQAPSTATAEATSAVSKTTSTTTSTLVTGAGIVRPTLRPVVRPPRVVPHVRVAPTLPTANTGRTTVAATTTTAPVGVSSTPLSSHIRRSQDLVTGAAVDVDLMELLLGTAPDDSASPQTSQDDVELASQSDSASQAKSVTPRSSVSSSRGSINMSSQKQTQSNKRGEAKQSQVQVTHAGASDSTTQPSGCSSTQGEMRSRPCVSTPSTSDMQQLMASLQARITALQQQPNNNDGSELHELLNRVQDELRALDTEEASTSANRKRKRDSEHEDDARLGRLLHEKLAVEVEMLRMQAKRERVLLDRERMKTDVEAALSRKRLEDAAISTAAIESIFANASARG